MCFVCGKDNPAGLKLSFEHPEPGRLVTTTSFSKIHQGYRDRVHGGLIAAVLDEMMVNLAWLEGTPAVTGELTVRLRKAVKVGETVTFEGRIEKRRGRLISAVSEARNASGEVLASATAKILEVNPPKG